MRKVPAVRFTFQYVQLINPLHNNRDYWSYSEFAVKAGKTWRCQEISSTQGKPGKVKEKFPKYN